MVFDIRTIIFIIGIAHLIQVFVFLQQYKANKNILGPGWWLLWSAAEMLGFVLLLLRGIPSILPYIIIVQSPIILLGTVFIYIGVMRFFEKKINIKIISIFFVFYFLSHLYFFVVKDDINIRVLILDAFLVVAALITVYSIYKNKAKSIASSANFLIVIIGIHGSIFIYRSVMILLGTPVPDYLSPITFNYIQYFDALIVGLLWTFGFIMMVNQRLNSETSEAKMHFEEIFNTSPDAAAINRLSDGKYIDCNENYIKISGYSKEDITGKSSIDINIWESPAERLEVVKMIEEKGYCENHEILFRRKDGKIITGLISAKLMDLKGVPHILSVTRDISERKKAEQEIKLKNEELHKLNSEKDKFLSIIAHDLKSPFNAIVGFSELLIDKANNNDLEEVKVFADTILKSSQRVMDLLTNLMIWSLSQTGRMNFNPEYFDLVSLIDENIQLFYDIADQKKITISREIEGNISVFADGDMISTIMRNLISNAIKFTTPGGKIILSVVKNQNEIKVSVKDTGVGISKAFVEKLFRIDENFTTRGTQNEQGTGLGLILCKEFIEKHGGIIGVESEPGKGSTFFFTVPNNIETV
jgi:PAS domain S-box-containing protein